MAVIAALGLAIRVLYVVRFRPHDLLPAPDAVLYHYGANLLAKGYGFIDPHAWLSQGINRPAADHPPAYMIYLAGFSLIGFSSVLAHMLASTLLGGATIVMVGLTGREVYGPKAGLAAAWLAALYPGLIAVDGLVQSETMAVLAVTTLAYVALRYRSGPTLAGAFGLGLLVGWAAMTRSEQLLLGVLVVVPLILATSGVSRERLLRLLAAGAGCIALGLPWLAFNASRFDGGVLLSTNLDYTIAATNCHDTWYGDRIGSWSGACAERALRERGLSFQGADQSERGAAFREAGLDYLGDHLTRLPVVVTARALRMLSLWDPPRQVRLDEEVEGREYWMAAASVGGFYLLSALAVTGAVSLARQRRLRSELIGPPCVVMIAAVLFMGNTRYRSPAEGVWCVLAAVGVVFVADRLRGRAGATNASPSDDGGAGRAGSEAGRAAPTTWSGPALRRRYAATSWRHRDPCRGM